MRYKDLDEHKKRHKNGDLPHAEFYKYECEMLIYFKQNEGKPLN